MKRLLSTIAILSFAAYATGQSVSVDNLTNVNQIVSQITDADIAAALTKVLASQEVLENPALVPLIQSAAVIGKSILDTAAMDGTTVVYQADKALKITRGATDTQATISGGGAVLEFNLLNDAIITELEQALAALEVDRDPVKAAKRVEIALADDPELSAQAIEAILKALFGDATAGEDTEGASNEEDTEGANNEEETEGANNEEETEGANNEEETEGANNEEETEGANNEEETEGANNEEETEGAANEEEAEEEGSIPKCSKNNKSRLLRGRN